MRLNNKYEYYANYLKPVTIIAPQQLANCAFPFLRFLVQKIILDARGFYAAFFSTNIWNSWLYIKM